MLRRFITSAAVLPLLTGVGIAATDKTGDLKAASASTQQTAESYTQNSRIRIVSAEQLVGKPVRAASGEDAGEIDYLLIGTDTGKIAFAAVDGGGIFDSGDELSVVPWSAVTISADGEELPARIKREDLARLYQQYDVKPYWEADFAQFENSLKETDTQSQQSPR